MSLPAKLLIANRGEIACRIARTARRLNIPTVAVYSTADAGARHVAVCDEAVCIGNAAPADSYLRAEAVIAAAHRTGAAAVHPGYGFLSENADFAEACAQSDLLFVGPPAAAIRAMGSKSAAKTLMGQVGVPLTPGYHGDNQEAAFLAAEAAHIGYPVLIKASAGGGGKGMRRVDRPADFAAALAGCQREALASFGDQRVLIECYVQRPRHIEIQVFADHFGQCVVLFERDCSVQRRHQKVLEEAPAPGMTTERRTAMGAAAIAAAKAVAYVGAGTVEFIVTPDGRFYFMEMNTRLQVEHPVTEMITGIDLVEWQLRVAAGERLPLAQADIAIKGHAVEARIYAEDATRGFVPSIGKIMHMRMPEASGHVRVDAGVATGNEITPYYDAMIAKLIVWDQTRELALGRMQIALAQCQIVGVTTNLSFLQRLMSTASVQAADLDTALIEREQAQLFAPSGALPAVAWLLIAVAILVREGAGSDRSPWSDTTGWRIGARARRSVQLQSAAVCKSVVVQYLDRDWQLELDDIVVQARGKFTDGTTLQAEIGDMRMTATVVSSGDRQHLYWAGQSCVVTVLDLLAQTAAVAADVGHLRSPMPGRIVSLLVDAGAVVSKGTPLLVLEAMKMEHTMLAPFAGRVASFNVAVGEQVPEGIELVELTGPDASA